MSELQPRIRDKRSAILAAATDLIVERGYAGTSLDAIVERAACSKTAIYELFDSKEGLLSALTEDIALEISQALHAFQLQHLDVSQALLRYARLALQLILNERHIAIVRATFAAVWKHPQLGVAYYEVGLATAQVALARYFQEQHKAGTLSVADPAQAAKQFQGLLFMERLVAQTAGAIAAPSPVEIEAQADAAVSAFLAIYS